MALKLTGDFRESGLDYLFLLQRGYPVSRILHMVCDRWRLDRVQRLALYRGVFPEDICAARKAKIVSLSDQPLQIDACNIFLTMSQFLYGREVFLCRDGFLRDAGGLYSPVEDEEMLVRGWKILSESILAVDESVFHVDRLTPSGQIISRILRQAEPKAAIVETDSADRSILRLPGGILATSDSELIDAWPGSVCDLARVALEKAFRPEWILL